MGISRSVALVALSLISVIGFTSSQNVSAAYDYVPIESLSWELHTVLVDDDKELLAQIRSDFNFKAKGTFATGYPVKFNVTSIEYTDNLIESIVFIFHATGETPETLVTGNLERGIAKLIEYGHAFRVNKVEDNENTFFLEDVWMPSQTGGMVISGFIFPKNGLPMSFTDDSVVLNVESYLVIENFEANKKILQQTENIDELQNEMTELKKQNTSSQNLNTLLAIFSIGSSIAAVIGVIYGIKKKRELVRSKLKTEQTKRSAYRSKQKAEDMRKGESFSKILKNLSDMFRGK